MSKYFYEWEDANDPFATGKPDLFVYPEHRLKTKRAALDDFRAYAKGGGFGWKPKMRLWKIGYEEVT
jgi:hypothetical protein